VRQVSRKCHSQPIPNRCGYNQITPVPSIEEMFQVLSADLSARRPDSANTILCPLCMRSFTFDAIAEHRLSVEHIVPSALDGTFEAITCTQCNNSHGSALESHLVKAMQSLDSLEGKGPIPGVFHNDGGHVAVNIEWRSDDATQIKIVGKASNPAGVNAIRDSIKDGATLNFTLKLGFMADPYYRAILRVAYLAAFAYFGYGFALSEGASQVRRALGGEPVPSTVVLEAHPDAELPSTALVRLLQAEGVGSFFLALFQLRSSMTRWLAVLMPGPEGCPWDRLAELATNFQNATLQVNTGGTAPSVSVRFSPEPLTKLQAIRIPARQAASDQENVPI
jgi:hypothetical protein